MVLMQTAYARYGWVFLTRHRISMLIPSQVMGVVDVKHTQENELTLEWESSVVTDMIADSTLALLLGIESSPASVKCESEHLNSLTISLDVIWLSWITILMMIIVCSDIEPAFSYPCTCRPRR